MFLLTDAFLIDEQIRQILRTHIKGGFKETSEYFNFRCHICGDDQYNKTVRKAYILKEGDRRTYYCHHATCGYSKSVTTWMKEYFQYAFNDYIASLIRNDSSEYDISPIVEEEVYDEKKDTKFFIPILKGFGNNFEIAKQLCYDRKIPFEVWKKWGVATGGTFKNRLIIPYFNGSEIYNWQARNLNDWEPRYISRKGDHNNIYNFYNVDKTKPVVIFEGVIDSLFVENSIAISGAGKIKTKLLREIPYKYFLMDSDAAGRKKSLQLLNDGKYVFSWKNFAEDFKIDLTKEKIDMNDVILLLNRSEGFKFSELEKYFTDSIFRKIEFL